MVAHNLCNFVDATGRNDQFLTTGARSVSRLRQRHRARIRKGMKHAFSCALDKTGRDVSTSFLFRMK